MKATPLDAYVLACVLAGQESNGERDRLSGPFVGMVDHLAGLLLEARGPAWAAMLAAREDGPELVKALAMADPNGPPPEPEAGTEAGGDCATLADVRRLVADTSWPWQGWLAGGVLNALAADPGTGKTITAMDIARRLWRGEPWPDGGANPFPPKSRTLWIAADRHYPQLLDLAAAFGLPDEAVMLNAPPPDPIAGLDLDDPATLADLEARIKANTPALVVIDTVGATTGRDLNRVDDAKVYFTPLADMAMRSSTAFLVLTHLNKDGKPIGRRIDGACRVTWTLTEPDPDGQPDRRRLEVTKTYAPKPPALGMTIGAAGCAFDFSPPMKVEPEGRRHGPPPAKVTAAKDWLAKELTPNPRRVSELRKEAATAGVIPSGSSAQTLYRARDELGANEYEVDGRKWWKLPVQDVQDTNSDNLDNLDNPADGVVQVVHPYRGPDNSDNGQPG